MAKGKSKNQPPGNFFLLFFHFQRDLGQHLGVVISNIQKERKLVDKAVSLLASNPRHPSLNGHKAKNVKAKYAEGGDSVFIAYVTKDLRFTFEYGPEPGMVALRSCGHHEVCERRV